jgi:cardiolipin synthase
MKNYSHAEKLTLIQSGTSYFEKLEELIDGARQSFHLQTYIFDYDETGKKVSEALIRAVKRKVRVYVLADAFGSKGFPAHAVKKLQSEGIHFRFFSPLFSAEGLAFGRRLHHKIALADQQAALVGGINIADKYNLTKEGIPWLDYAVLIEGNACHHLHTLCERLYKKKKLNRFRKRETAQDAPEKGKGLIRFRRNDWVQRENEIHKTYLEALIKAEKSITLVASYFMPGRTFRKLLKEAIDRNVEIRILVAGKSDVPIFRFAETYLYHFYLQNKIRIFEWNRSVMHGKAMVVDESWATIGSYNLNYLSHYISIELNADIIDPDFVIFFSEHLKKITTVDCVEVTREISNKRLTLFTRLEMAFGYFVYRFIMEMMMGGRNRRERKIKGKSMSNKIPSKGLKS